MCVYKYKNILISIFIKRKKNLYFIIFRYFRSFLDSGGINYAEYEGNILQLIVTSRIVGKGNQLGIKKRVLISIF